MTLSVAEVTQQDLGLVLGERGGEQKKNITSFPLMAKSSEYRALWVINYNSLVSYRRL